MGSIHEKNQGPKILCYCTFKSDVVGWGGGAVGAEFGSIGAEIGSVGPDMTQ